MASSGQVVSKGTFSCESCDKTYGNKKDMEEHIKQHSTTKEADKPADEVELEVEEDDSETIAKEIENLMTVDTLVESFVDMAFRVLRPSEAPETTEMEDKYNLLFRQHHKLNDKCSTDKR